MNSQARISSALHYLCMKAIKDALASLIAGWRRRRIYVDQAFNLQSRMMLFRCELVASCFSSVNITSHKIDSLFQGSNVKFIHQSMVFATQTTYQGPWRHPWNCKIRPRGYLGKEMGLNREYGYDFSIFVLLFAFNSTMHIGISS